MWVSGFFIGLNSVYSTINVIKEYFITAVNLMASRVRKYLYIIPVTKISPSPVSHYLLFRATLFYSKNNCVDI